MTQEETLLAGGEVEELEPETNADVLDAEANMSEIDGEGESGEDEGDEVDLAEAEAEYDDAAIHEGEKPNDGENVQPDEQPNLEHAASVPKKIRAPTCPLDLPISVVRRIMKTANPNKRFTPDLIAAFARCSGAFALFLLSACQEAATEAGRTTIEPAKVITGLVACGFPEIAEEARLAMGISAAALTGRKKKGKRSKPNRN
jgi:histone H3/H4